MLFYSLQTFLMSCAVIYNTEVLVFSYFCCRSVTGTPCRTPHVSNSLTATPVCGKAVGSFGTECVNAFNAIMIDKFRNARSPPSSVNSPSSGFNSPS